MTIKFRLQPKHLPGEASRYSARVVYSEVVDLEGLIETMDLRGASITRSDMLAVFEVLLQTLLYLLWRGVRIVTPFGEFGLTIKGDFSDEADNFDPRRHRVELLLKPGERLKEEFAQKVEVRRQQKRVPSPILTQCTNLADPTAAGLLSPGRMARLRGYDLKFDPADPEQGIFLIPLPGGLSSDPQAAPIRVSEVGRNKGRELIFVVPPNLAVGAYALEVHAAFGQSLIRHGRLEETLLVP